jgi:NADPH:quinone reductase-like Zn-dependent oxidoreductase
VKTIVIEAFGGVEQLKFKKLPTPFPANDEVQIKILYTAVNPVDWKIREGYLKERVPHQFPIVLGWDAAGIISAVGKDVQTFKEDDEVYAYCRKPLVQWGTYAEYICVDHAFVALKPKNLTFAQAASIPLAGLTAWQSLFDAGKLSRGETVLIHAGAGGVGGMAIQFAKTKGAKVFTTASAANHDYVKSLGADVVIDYGQEDFLTVIREQLPKGVDLACDFVGGDVTEKTARCVKRGGRMVSILDKLASELSQRYGIEAHYVFVQPNGQELREIAGLIEQGKVSSPEIMEMRLEDAAIAHEQIRTGHTKGKIVLKVAD